MTPGFVDIDKARRGALKAYREGRVTVKTVAYDGSPRALAVGGVVRGHTGLHEITYLSDRWDCTCGVPIGCPHVLAVQLVTGHAGNLAANSVPAAPAAGDDPLDECRHGMVPTYCADCTGRDGGQAELEAERAELLTRRGWTTAAYGGRCALCGERYEQGEPIRAVSRPEITGTTWADSCCKEDTP